MQELMDALYTKFCRDDEGDVLFSVTINVIRSGVEITVHDDTDGEGELCYSAHCHNHPEYRDSMRVCCEKIMRGLKPAMTGGV